MSTPFAPTMDDLMRIWNSMIEGLNIPYEDEEVPQEIREKGTAIRIHYPTPEHLPPRQIINFSFMFTAYAIMAYDNRLENFLREKNLL